MRYLRFVSGPRMGSRLDIDRLSAGRSNRRSAGSADPSGRRAAARSACGAQADRGPLAGRQAGERTEPTLILGRERTTDVPIDDPNISRRHAEIVLREDTTVLRDLASTNGTFVNGELVTEKMLANGDRISLGDSVMIFEETGPGARVAEPGQRRPGTRTVTFHDKAYEPGSSQIRLDPKVSGYLDPAAIRARPEAAERLAKLYKFISEVAPVVSPERLAEEVLDRAFEAMRADRGFIMLLDEAGNLRPEHMRLRDPARPSDSIQLSRRATRQVIESGQSILSADALHDGRFKDTAAISVDRVNSFVCAPLKHRDKVIGLLYVDTVGLTKPLDKDDLELVTAMARLAGTQFANARYYADVMNSAEYTQGILRCLRSGLVVTDLDLSIRQVNEAACELLGRRERELVGRSFTEFKTLEPLWRIMQETVRSGIPSERQEIVVEIAGEQVPLGVSNSLLRDHENRLRGVVASFRSLKVINKLSEQLRMAQHLAALGEMAAGVAHEVRNPLNSIRGFAQLLAEMLPGVADADKLEAPKNYLNIIIEEVDRMNQLVQDLLDFSRQRELTMMDTDLAKLVDGTLHELSPDLAEADVEVVRNIPEGPIRLVANAAKLKQVLVNVIRNAIQAMTPPAAPEGRARRLEVGLSLVGEPGAPVAVQIAVADSGTGMDEETRARIFEPFFTTRERGTGLGLAICRKILEKHGGTMEVESQLGAGTTVRVVLPRG